MADYPITSRNPNTFSEKNIKGQYKAETDSNYMITAARGTTSKKEFELGYTSLSDSEKSTLESFFDANLGGSFNYTHPISGAVYSVFFVADDDSLDFDYDVHIRKWITNFKLREV